MSMEKIGICRDCKEWTELNDSCCGAPVYIEGSWETPDEESEGEE